jgi:hypothetical protein
VRGAGLLHPVALAAIALLVLNDHVLKGAIGGPITGKLSDFAGLLFFPLMLQAGWELFSGTSPSRRVLLLAAGATAAVFAAVQVLPLATDAYRHGLGWLQFPVRALLEGARAPMPVAATADPTDLIALPCAAIAVWIGWGR